MKRLRAVFLIYIVLLSFFTCGYTPAVSAGSYALIDVPSGRILYSADGDEQLPMASTTKIMTAILAIESGRLSETVTVSKSACGVEGSSIYLEEGEQFTLMSLVYGLMLRSGNDAATAIAEFIGGSIDQFVEMMNAKAIEIGAEHTHFDNPHGLPSATHYTTAADLARISAYCLRNETFAGVCSTQYVIIEPSGAGEKRTLKNKNKLLWTYDGATGVKTGYTSQAGKCYVASAQRDDTNLAAVLLHTSDMWGGAKELLNYGFQNYTGTQLIICGEYVAKVNVENGIEEHIELFASEGCSAALTEKEKDDISLVIDIPESVKAPIESGSKIGKLGIYIGDEQIGEIDLVTVHAVQENTFFYRAKKIIADYIGLT